MRTVLIFSVVEGEPEIFLVIPPEKAWTDKRLMMTASRAIVVRETARMLVTGAHVGLN